MQKTGTQFSQAHILHNKVEFNLKFFLFTFIYNLCSTKSFSIFRFYQFAAPFL